MGFLVSPGIEINEVDLTNIVPSTSTSVGGYAGHFNWGPAEFLVTVGSETELGENFGTPRIGNTTRSFLTAASFLKYSNSLRVSRAIDATARNAANNSQILIKNKDEFDTLGVLNFVFSARYPGAIGNSIKVAYAYTSGNGGSNYESWPYRNLFDSVPGQSVTAIEQGINSNDEINLVVVDELGLLTGTVGAVLEKFEGLSLATNAKSEDGASVYYRDVINNGSAYIYVGSVSSSLTGADTDIDALVQNQFGIAASATESESSANVPFLLDVETVVTYSGGASETFNDIQNKTVQILSGYNGPNGNNVRINFSKIGDITAAQTAHGFIQYNDPLDGDTVIVAGTTFTKVASAPGAAEFVDIDGLVSLVDALSNVAATKVGTNVIRILASTAGVAGNAVTLAIGSNSGDLGISGPTLIGGADANTAPFTVTIDPIDPANGFVTYNVTVDTNEITTLAALMQEIVYQAVTTGNDLIGVPGFKLDGEDITPDDPKASMVLDLAVLIPSGNLTIVSFSGGEIVNYENNTLIETYNLTGGLDGTIDSGNLPSALDVFSDKDLVEINLLFAENFEAGQTTVDSKVYEIANGRRDIIGFISAPLSIVTQTSNAAKKASVLAKFNSLGSSSYIVFDSSPVYTYNKYADRYVWIPAGGHMAGLCAHADFVADPWFSPAGYNRGHLQGVAKIAFNPNQTDRDDLYKARVNSIITVPGQGILLFGDKTALSKPSAFDRINVRRLFNVLERSIALASKYQLFEFNDEFTRASFKNTIEPFLRDVQGRRGIIEFRVICDETNNTPQVIDANEFVGDIYVKPNRSINYGVLKFIATRTGVDFKEIVGS